MANTAPATHRQAAREMNADEALIALFIAAMDANGHVARDELARAHHLIWSTRRFRRKSGDTVGRLIQRMKRLIEDAEDPAAVLERASRALPSSMRRPAFAVVADLLLSDGKIDGHERRFLRRLAVNLKMPSRTAAKVVEMMLLKNQL